MTVETVAWLCNHCLGAFEAQQDGVEVELDEMHGSCQHGTPPAGFSALISRADVVAWLRETATIAHRETLLAHKWPPDVVARLRADSDCLTRTADALERGE